MRGLLALAILAAGCQSLARQEPPPPPPPPLTAEEKAFVRECAANTYRHCSGRCAFKECALIARQLTQEGVLR